MRTPTTRKQSKTVSTPVAVIIIVLVLVAAGLIGWKVLSPKPIQGVMSRAATLAAGSRYKFVKDRWDKEVALAKKEGRAPDTRLQPRPTSMVQSGNRPLGMENMGPGSLATRPGENAGQEAGGVGLPGAGR
jgi:hypothetical protein